MTARYAWLWANHENAMSVLRTPERISSPRESLCIRLPAGPPPVTTSLTGYVFRSMRRSPSAKEERLLVRNRISGRGMPQTPHPDRAF